ncbi:MAG: type II secretion system F family protein [Calditrichia bacterium]|nr:type II secretion system F family protein [Calditrichota bacterium]MCB9068389.1 type II secretion system F family protein [Calditrichia bacterium]
MPDFRFEGTTLNGRAIQGTVVAESLSEAKTKVRKLADKHKVKVSAIQKRKTFLFKAQKAGEEPFKGEQKAFTKDEVQRALERLGYKVLSVQPKLIDFKLPPPEADVVTFVRVSADMLRENLQFNEVLQMLVNDTENVTLREAIKEINNDLRQGKDSEEAFIKQEKALGAFAARMLGLASKSGNMVSIYESTAKFLERNAEFKRNLKSALIMPLFTVLILMGAVFYYVGFIFPETAKLFMKLGTELPPMTSATLALSDFMVENIWIIMLLLLSGTGLLVYYFVFNPKGRFVRDRYILKMPFLGSLIHKTVIEIFCRVFYALYSGSGENIDAIKLAAEASGNRYFEKQIKTIAIPMMLNKGLGLVQAFEATGVFTKTALARFNSGSETGTVKNSALQIANYYEKETVYKLKNAIEFIQLTIAMFIMIVITALTLISAETALMKPKTPYG